MAAPSFGAFGTVLAFAVANGVIKTGRGK